MPNTTEVQLLVDNAAVRILITAADKHGRLRAYSERNSIAGFNNEFAERSDSVSLMYFQPSGSGAKYQGRNETFWEHQGETSITWGYGAPQMRCNIEP